MLLFDTIEKEILKKEFPLYKYENNILLNFFIVLLFNENLLEFEFEDDEDEKLIEMLLTIFNEEKMKKSLKNIYFRFFLDKKTLKSIAIEELLLQGLIKEKRSLFKIRFISEDIIYGFLNENIN